ncbi:hypothetical protein B0T20DRAFT_272673 [Sordaria brevicollis]|uniref:Uncharacterized protein n=1 Tax=Sordaria brevicollis TaxID=83679 RepID=A0AAE0PAM0_SORBR|nr:hypothetical protein B0T20DRAFT_272673 [Sordaria brevicollis]
MSNQPPGQQGQRGLPYRPAATPASTQPQPQLSSQQPHPTLTTRRSHLSPTFASKLRQLALPLAPLVQLTSGTVHPEFPSTLLNFWLLTDDQLDRLASFYHQRTPCQWTSHYPCPVSWPSGMGIEEKRRRIGRFIGLRGCESPVPSGTSGPWTAASVNGTKKDEENGQDGDAMEVDAPTTETEPSSGEQRKGLDSPTDISAYVAELLRSTLASPTADEDVAETERKIMKAEDELEQIRKKMGWYF